MSKTNSSIFSSTVKCNTVDQNNFSLDLEDCYVEGNQEIYRGQNISLTCHGNGHPYPLLTWSLHGEQLKTNSRIRTQGNKLDIFNATINDGGQYKCVVYNEVGNVSCGVVVKVIGLYKIVLIIFLDNYAGILYIGSIRKLYLHF